MKNGTDQKSEKPIRSAIKLATKVLKISYLYVKSSKSYEYQHKFRPFGPEKEDEWLEENLMKNGTDPKSEKPIRTAIKFATKAVNTPYLYVNPSESYKRKTDCSVFHTFIGNR